MGKRTSCAIPDAKDVDYVCHSSDSEVDTRTGRTAKGTQRRPYWPFPGIDRKVRNAKNSDNTRERAHTVATFVLILINGSLLNVMTYQTQGYSFMNVMMMSVCFITQILVIACSCVIRRLTSSRRVNFAWRPHQPPGKTATPAQVEEALTTVRELFEEYSEGRQRENLIRSWLAITAEDGTLEPILKERIYELDKKTGQTIVNIDEAVRQEYIMKERMAYQATFSKTFYWLYLLNCIAAVRTINRITPC